MRCDVAKIIFKKNLLLCFVFLQAGYFYAQSRQRDTVNIYKKIKRIAFKKKAGIFLYQSIFVDPTPEHYEQKPLSEEQKKEDPDKKYEGKIIRNILIEVYDPFGYSVNDTTYREVHSIQKMANRYHIKTRRRIIRNLLLFKKNDLVDLIAVNESERLLREMNYITDARIYFIDSTKNNDSIDVKVIVKDKWSVSAPFSLATTSGNMSLNDNNIFGSGQAYTQYFAYTMQPYTYSLRGNYLITNIKNTYISSNFFYSTTSVVTQTGFSFNRPFYSALAKWAGGVAGNKTWTSCSDGNTVPQKYLVHFYTYDNWIAKSFRLTKGRSRDARLGKLIVAARCAGTVYDERPPAAVDVSKSFFNSSLNIASIGFSLNKYYKDQFIYRFGANEDIPEGFMMQVVAGVSTNEIIGMRYYNGFEISVGKHVKDVGYFSANTGYGIFYNKSVLANSTLTTGFVYFTDLIQNKKWYFRQFVYGKYVAGFNKDISERITIKSTDLYGFNSGSQNGTSKALLNLATVLYTPYNIGGFRFAPVVFVGFGTMGDPHQAVLLKNKIYQAYSIGVLVRNENLLISSFEFTVGFYPNLPDGNKNVFRINPVTSFALKVRNFAISKPSPVLFE